LNLKAFKNKGYEFMNLDELVPLILALSSLRSQLIGILEQWVLDDWGNGGLGEVQVCMVACGSPLTSQ
jgi:hypothetical protein